MSADIVPDEPAEAPDEITVADGLAANSDPEQPQKLPEVLSLLPLRDFVIFPVLVSPLGVGRDSSVKLINDAVLSGTRIIATATLRDPSVDEPGLADLYPIGTAVAIRMMGQLPDGLRLIVQGLGRIEIQEAVQTTPYLQVRYRFIEEPAPPAEQSEQVEALKRVIVDLFTQAVALSPDMGQDLLGMITSISDPGTLADLIAAQTTRLSTAEKQRILQAIPVADRMQALLEVLSREVQVLKLGEELNTRVASDIDSLRREQYLRQQMKAIARELGETDSGTHEIEELRERIAQTPMSDEALKEANRELSRLERIPTASPEFSVARTFLDWLLALPWETATEDCRDIAAVRRSLDADHNGLADVKERILEFLAVRSIKSGTLRQPILCLAGPPGVGKTSLGRSIANALGRKFIRMSLGGVRDEAEVRGHRRTYVGAMPGQIIQSIRRCGSNNPVFMLDEIDKVTADMRGDPSSALLEVLDPEQNSTFRDHYLDVVFDLSKVMFIATANVLETIAPPLRDRMEVIRLSGYTEAEKLAIARNHLVPKQVAEHGIRGRISFRTPGLQAIIRGYTREAGVRNLERVIAGICRKVTLEFAEGKSDKAVISSKTVERLLGSPLYESEELDPRLRLPGVATGLVWTPVGGDIVHIEAAGVLRTGERPPTLTLTGQLGEVMRESAQTALSYLRANSKPGDAIGSFMDTHDIHIHVPAGATPKDGPSAGITMATALASLAMGAPVAPRVAMTGEITLSGRVMPVGGVKEKVIAAHRAGVEKVILSSRNRRNVEEEVPAEVRDHLTFVYVDAVGEVLAQALLQTP